ncbi:MAG TPA: hypothetical protein VJR89_00975, partial [Polyangiales bacterium]|nr:hypothetical protein [Polyangiales bacterium]
SGACRLPLSSGEPQVRRRAAPRAEGSARAPSAGAQGDHAQFPVSTLVRATQSGPSGADAARELRRRFM